MNYDVEICWVYVTLLCIVLLGLIIGFILYCCYCFDEDEKKEEEEMDKMEDMEKKEMMDKMNEWAESNVGEPHSQIITINN